MPAGLSFRPILAASPSRHSAPCTARFGENIRRIEAGHAPAPYRKRAVTKQKKTGCPAAARIYIAALFVYNRSGQMKEGVFHMLGWVIAISALLLIFSVCLIVSEYRHGPRERYIYKTPGKPHVRRPGRHRPLSASLGGSSHRPGPLFSFGGMGSWPSMTIKKHKYDFYLGIATFAWPRSPIAGTRWREAIPCGNLCSWPSG